MKVRISLQRRTEYGAIIEMPEEKFRELSDAMNKGWPHSKKAEEEINSLMKPGDWQDDRLDNIDEFERD